MVANRISVKSTEEVLKKNKKKSPYGSFTVLWYKSKNLLRPDRHNCTSVHSNDITTKNGNNHTCPCIEEQMMEM